MLWGLDRGGGAEIDVTTRGNGRSRKGIKVHVVRNLDPADIASAGAIPCTTVARTLLDLAEVVNRRNLERAEDQAEALRIFDGRALEDVLARAAGRRGAPILRSVLNALDAGATVTESELEERFLTLCVDAAIPRPRVNAWIALQGGAVRADFLWPEQRLIVETDGQRVHGSRRAFEQDRRRDQRLQLARYRVVRVTWRQLADHPDQVAKVVVALLAEA